MKRFIKGKLLSVTVLILLIIAGCSKAEKSDADIVVFGDDLNVESDDEAQQIANLYRDIYVEAIKTNTIGNLGVTKSIVNCLGENGYIAIDSENQIDMTRSEQVIQFCKSVDSEQNAEMTIIAVTSLGGFTKYDFETANGNVNIVRGYYQYENGVLKNMSTVSYPADLWQYTEEGYLLFEGSCFSDEYYVLTLNEMPERTALRVEPLDEKCRELNRQYILPLGYKLNNMFITNWSEVDFENLDFYDLFDNFYQIVYKESNPYIMNSDIETGSIYRIPKKEFEDVIMAYFNIDSQTLQSKTTYFSTDMTYGYRPRGFYDAEYPDIPYPEVVAYEENTDRTITLTVNAVYQNDNTSRAFSHIVVVRLLNDGCFQYVSNHMIFPEDAYEAWWHSERLTEDTTFRYISNTIEKKESEVPIIADSIVGNVDLSEQIGKGYNLPVSDVERNEAETDCFKVLEIISDIFRNADKGDASNVVLSDETILKMQTKLKESKCTVTTSLTYSNMENYECVNSFLNACTKGVSGKVIVYELHIDGAIERTKYIFDGTNMYVLSTIATLNKENEPKITYFSYDRIQEKIKSGGFSGRDTPR